MHSSSGGCEAIGQLKPKDRVDVPIRFHIVQMDLGMAANLPILVFTVVDTMLIEMSALSFRESLSDLVEDGSNLPNGFLMADESIMGEFVTIHREILSRRVLSHRSCSNFQRKLITSFLDSASLRTSVAHSKAAPVRA